MQKEGICTADTSLERGALINSRGLSVHEEKGYLRVEISLGTASSAEAQGLRNP